MLRICSIRDVVHGILSDAMEKTRSEISGGIQDAIVPMISGVVFAILVLIVILFIVVLVSKTRK